MLRARSFHPEATSNFRKWLEQRPRQAYEDFDMRAKTILFMSLLPSAIALGLIEWRRVLRWRFSSSYRSAPVLLAGRGLWRDQGVQILSRSCDPLCAALDARACV